MELTVSAVDDPPVITGQSPLSLAEDTALELTLAALTVTDADNAFPDGFTLLVRDGDGYTREGTTITPAQDYAGPLSVTVTVRSGESESAPVALAVTVLGVNDAPVVSGQRALATLEEEPFTVDLEALTFTDPDAEDVHTLAVRGGDGYTHEGPRVTPRRDVTGPLSVSVTVSDGEATSAPFLLVVDVAPVNDPPQITASRGATTPEDTPVFIGRDQVVVRDPDDSDFTVKVLDGGSYTHDGNLVTPPRDFSGSLQVNVRVNDGSAVSANAIVPLTVTPVNDAPIITGQREVAYPEDTVFSVIVGDVTAADVDNAFPADFSITVHSGEGYTHIGNLVRPATDFSGALVVPVTVSDGFAESARFELQVTVAAVNDAPEITGQDPITTREDTPVTLTFPMLDVTDPDDAYPAGFTLRLESGIHYTRSGAIVTPEADFNGTLHVTVTVDDGDATSDPFELDVTVTPVDDAPSIDGQRALATPQDTPLEVTLLDLVVSDPDNVYPDDFSLQLQGGAHYTVAATSVEPEAGFQGVLHVPVTVESAGASSAIFTLQITVTAPD